MNERRLVAHCRLSALLLFKGDSPCVGARKYRNMVAP
jgi:hypothetical protein